VKRYINALFSPAGLFILVIVSARLVFLQQIKLPLSPDEAYYWDWGRHLAWGYYSKPPMVAWLIALSTHFLGISEYSVRIPAWLCGGLYLVFLYFFSLRLFDEQVGLWSILAAAATPIMAVYSFVMTIDPPLLMFWALALWVGWLAAETPSLGRFALLGLVIGLGLLSKQTMVAFPVFYFLWLYYHPESRKLLRKPGPYLAVLLAFIMCVPTLWWNAQHHWIMFKHTSTHFKEQAFRLDGPLFFLVEQAGVITPITFVLMLLGFYLVITREKLRKIRQVTYLFFLSALPLGLVLPLAFLRKVNANWPAPFYTSAFLLVAVLCLRTKWPQKRGVWVKRSFLMGVLLGFIITIMLYKLPVMPQKFPPAVRGLLYKFDGWPELAQVTTKKCPPGAVIIAGSRDYAAELAFYLPGHPYTYTLWEGSYRSQYDIWDGLGNKIGRRALVVTKGPLNKSTLNQCLCPVKFLGAWEKKLLGGHKTIRAYFYSGRLRHCPWWGPTCPKNVSSP